MKMDPQPRRTLIPASILPLQAALTSAVGDDDAFFEYGYVWLPYAVAGLLLLVLGAIAAIRWRRSAPGVAELLITSGALLALLAAIVLGLADGAAEGNGLASMDQPVWQWMIDQRTPSLTSLAILVTNIGSTVAMSVIAGCAVIYLLVRRRWGDATLVAVVAAGAGLLVRVGKATVGRQRPPADFRLVTETNESFPSGHALASAAILGVVLVVFLPSIKNAGVRIAVCSAVGLFVLAIGLSRLYLGVHWATDVLGGWVTGLAWLALCLTVRELWRLTRGRRQSVVGDATRGGDAAGGGDTTRGGDTAVGEVGTATAVGIRTVADGAGSAGSTEAEPPPRTPTARGSDIADSEPAPAPTGRIPPSPTP